jgi:hypothetical protein
MLSDASVFAVGWPTWSLTVSFVSPNDGVVTFTVETLQSGLGTLVGPDSAASNVSFSLSLQALDLGVLALDLALTS